jgi:anti-sigma factor RsiW
MEDESHVVDDLLELYSLNRLSGDELAAVEAHLLVCPACRERLVQTDGFVKAMQSALRKLEAP